MRPHQAIYVANQAQLASPTKPEVSHQTTQNDDYEFNSCEHLLKVVVPQSLFNVIYFSMRFVRYYTGVGFTPYAQYDSSCRFFFVTKKLIIRIRNDKILQTFIQKNPIKDPIMQK